MTSTAAGALRAKSTWESNQAQREGLVAGFQRGREDWKLQASLADKDFQSLGKQIEAANI